MWLFRETADSRTLGLGQETYQIRLKHPFVSESKAAIKDNSITVCKLYLKNNKTKNWGRDKRTPKTTQRASDPRWEKVN